MSEQRTLTSADVAGNVVGLPVPEPERYVTRAELAHMMGLSVTTIDRMVAEGLPSETWGRRSRRFRPSVAIAWARTRSRAA
jgi:phage terminase Nu1 subunit (DNA packaging protein)